MTSSLHSCATTSAAPRSPSSRRPRVITPTRPFELAPRTSSAGTADRSRGPPAPARPRDRAEPPCCHPRALGPRRARQNSSFDPSRVARQLFGRRRSPRLTRRGYSPIELPTAFFTARARASRFHEKAGSIHPQFTLNPQLAHRLPSALCTLRVAHLMQEPPKSVALFLARIRGPR